MLSAMKKAQKAYAIEEHIGRAIRNFMLLLSFLLRFNSNTRKLNL
jgi:hypothetical protein